LKEGSSFILDRSWGRQRIEEAGDSRRVRWPWGREPWARSSLGRGWDTSFLRCQWLESSRYWSRLKHSQLA